MKQSFQKHLIATIAFLMLHISLNAQTLQDLIILRNGQYIECTVSTIAEDFIYYKGLNFNMGSALKYRWRAGHKDGESREKDLAKCEHYIRFETECRKIDRTSFSVTDTVRKELDSLVFEANSWGGQ
jgi:hypothetical protein